ncbi:ABC transporter permease [Paucilactobacillus hokkaidonensis JCM 18461]|uniref:ABC transporter permease n=2 Tax=Paucilactobacillus hokkaidonensis TaxID=1193095 RepID=A0A0A1GSI3_9LACO|nr:metal ABC transporter permease [Paucilactobacillus hokkaidonensis]KRO09693.1 zinc iron ABC transporter permease [Paucilactobacillus hokkaidonensis]BAP84950.1 ABC transporter permease [Paucilactobacillus hokkaidonensis JCM 18461]
MFSFDFMRHAFVAGTFIALICGIIGVFVIARSMSFLTHTLSEIGFAGAAFGVFAGWPAINGMLLFTIVSSVIVGQMSVKAARRESAITAVSALFIGLGILFLSLSNQNASSATSILFGSVIGISQSEVWQIIGLSVVVLLVILFSYRSLKFDSFDSVGARVNGVKSNLVSIVFLIVLALSVSIAAQIVGSLLIFILLTLPAASAKYFVHSVFKMMVLSIGFALIGTWCGLYLGYLTNWPVSFFIASLEVIIYCIALLHARRA